MSIEVFGNESFVIKDLNTQCRLEEVNINVPSLLNRKTEARTLRRYLNCRGGFDAGLWQPPLVAELPDGTKFLFDGDHRRALYRKNYPNRSKMPAQVIAVKSRQEIHRMFVAINKTARKSLTANEIFVHQVRAEDPRAIAVEKQLAEVRLSVSLGTGDEGSIVGSQKGYYNSTHVDVNIGGFESIMQDTNLGAVKWASKLIQELWPTDSSLSVELLGGVARLCKKTPLRSRPFINRAFKEFIGDYITALKTQKKVSGHFKMVGGAVVNHHDESVAYGMMVEFYDSIKDSKSVSLTTYRACFGVYKKELKVALVQ